MAEKLQELKAKQEELNSKLSIIQEANRKKDQDAAEIKELLTSCKDRLDHIKEMTSPPEYAPSTSKRVKYEDQMEEWEKEKSLRKVMRDERGEEVSENGEKKITCRIDLSKMKIRVKGPPEDLKNLNAAQLISMLDKSGCQELIINTDETQKNSNCLGEQSKAKWPDYCGEIPIMYFTHPGHLVMLAGVILIATLVNTNLCNPRRGPRVKSIFNVVYLSTFAFQYGMILWMKVVRGYSLRSELSRETFNQVDNLILPKYYSLSVFLSALSFYSYLATRCDCEELCMSWPPQVTLQIFISIILFFLELATVSYVVPAVVKLREVTDEFLSDEDGPGLESEDFERNMEKLLVLNRTLSLVNLLTTMLLGANMYYITTKLNLD